MRVNIWTRLCFVPIITFLKSNAFVVETKNGPVLGTLYNQDSLPIYAFKNVPYARPPLGHLRFETPQDVEPWLSTTDLAPSEKKIWCPQLPYFSHNNNNSALFGQEDCLLLDIYVRSNFRREPVLPVLVYFHGGQFSSGSKNEYHPELLISQHNIVVVIPNYRLGVLGFLSSGDGRIAGNLGVWDQRHALKWVRDNIDSFGGDRNKVTIAGHDAGGASVGMHILSPHATGFFRAAISGSGSVLDPWVLSPQRLPPTAPLLAEKVNCSTAEDIVACLKRCELRHLLESVNDLKKVYFLPTVDKERGEESYLPDIPQKLYQIGNYQNVSLLAGVTKNEASIEVFKHFPRAVKHKHLDHIILSLIEPYFRGSSDAHIVAKAAKYHYLRGKVIPSFDSIQPDMEMVVTDFLYNSPLHSMLNLHSLRSSKTYMYVFSFGDNHSPFGVSHMVDAFYLFNKSLGEFTPRFQSKNMRKVMCDIWGRFVKTQQPGNSALWKTYKGIHQTNYVEIADKLSHRTNYRKSAMEFWNLLVPDLQYYHNLDIKESAEHTNHAPDSYGWGVAGMCVLLLVLGVAMVGVVSVTRRRYTQSSIISSPKDDIKYTTIT